MLKNVLHFTLFSLMYLLWTILPANAQFFNEQGLKITKLYGWVDNNYVDSINLPKLNEEMIRLFLQKLDPHSTYIGKNEVEAMNEQLQGNFDGIGITFSTINDTIVIINIVKDGPAYKAGIKPGDRLISVGDEVVAGRNMSSKVIYSRLRGKKDSNVTIGIRRPGTAALLSFNLIRDKIPIVSIDAAYPVDTQTGYIRLERFSATSTTELQKVFTQFKEAHIKNIILDLSDNGGGFFDVAVSLADEFLSDKKLIVYTQGLHSEKKEYYSTPNGTYEKGKLVVIINEGSASASEIVAGAIQDWDRGLIIGRRSFGKGLVQRQFSFPDTSMLRLTIARYYTPSGRLIQKPYNKGYKDYNDDLSNRIQNGELLGKEIFSSADSVKHFTLEKNRPVFGGGGIVPDIFVPLDTTDSSPYFRKLKSKGILTGFAIEYLDKHRNNFLTDYPIFTEFKKSFLISDSLLDTLIKYAERKSLPYSQAEFERSKSLISVQLKAYIAKDYWGQNEFFEIYNVLNKSFTKALETIAHWNNFAIAK